MCEECQWLFKIGGDIAMEHKKIEYYDLYFVVIWAAHHLGLRKYLYKDIGEIKLEFNLKN